MKIALISDIHSNQFAFQAVLDDLKQHDIDQIFFLGDYTFGGSGSVECVDMLRNYDFHRKRYFEKFDDWSMNTVISMLTGCNYIGTQDLRK